MSVSNKTAFLTELEAQARSKARSDSQSDETGRGKFCKVDLHTFLTASLIFSSFLVNFSVNGQCAPVYIQPEIQFQRMDGFGAAGVNGCAQEVYSQAEPRRTKLLNLLFGPDGARINILRNEIWWTGKRLPFTHPLYLRGLIYYFGDEDNESAQYFLMREAQKRQEMILNSCVWTPPPQWKTNNSFKDGGELLPSHYEDFADYLLGYLEFYKKIRNQDFQLISLQNRPDKKQGGESCSWNGEQLRDFVKVVGSRLRQRGYPTKIMLPEVEWEQAGTYLQPILADPEARRMISYLGVHSSRKSSSDRMALNNVCKSENFKLWQSEFAVPEGRNPGNIDDGLLLATQMLEDLVQSDCHAWLYWALMTPLGSDEKKQGLLERTGTRLEPSKKFWCFTQFSRFIPRDAVRIAVRGNTSPMIAFRNPEYNGMTLVMINSTPDPMTENLEMRGWTMERLLAYRTSEKEDCVQVPLPPESASKQSMALEPKSVTTVVAQIRRLRQ